MGRLAVDCHQGAALSVHGSPGQGLAVAGDDSQCLASSQRRPLVDRCCLGHWLGHCAGAALDGARPLGLYRGGLDAGEGGLRVAQDERQRADGVLAAAESEQEIEQIILSFGDVQQPHHLRTRRIGNRIAIEAHVRMDGRLTLNTVHERATTIERKLKERFGDNTHVTLHMEPIKENAVAG